MITNKVITIALTKQLSSTITITRNGQNNPSDGDEVKVKLTISLPTGKDGYLINELNFKERVVILKYNLCSYWGNFDSNNRTRNNSKELFGTNWKRLFKQAEEEGILELQKLIDALKLREIALIKAEEEEEEE